MKSEYKFQCYTLALLAGALLRAGDANASYPEGYYDSLEGKCGSELIEAIKARAIDHKQISYSDGTWAAFLDTDVKTENGVDYWWDMYSNELVRVSSGHPGLNVEHSVANSWWGKSKNAAYKDIVHLNPSNSDANSRKSNYPLAELGSVTWTNGVTSVGKPKSGQGGGNSWGYEPADEYKGDFARVFMYMFTVYNDISWDSAKAWMFSLSGGKAVFRDWAKDLLLRWNSTDPVSQKERDRNDGIMRQQENRNPFIDLPDLADHIWGAKSDEPFYIDGNGENPPVDPEDPEDPELPVVYHWLPSTATSMDADWTIENVTLPEKSDYVWSWKSNSGKYYLNASAFVGGTAYTSEAYAWSPVVDLAGCESAELSFDHAAKFQTTLRTLCHLAVRDMATGGIDYPAIPEWPAAGNWTFVPSGTIDLGDYLGHRVQIGLHYASSAAGADTWEIRDMKLNLTRGVSAVDDLAEETDDDSCFVEVWGNNILVPEGARIYDLNGREVSGENVARGVYIVTKPTFRTNLKILVK